MAASIKQMNFIKNLFKEASDGTEKLVAAGQDEVVASFAAKVQPLEDILIGVLNDREISGQDARQAIDTLIEVTRQIKVALPKPAQPVGLAALNADKVIPNRFGKKCSCGTMVNPGEGFAALVRGRWLTVCQDCANTDPAAKAAADQALLDAVVALINERDALAGDVFKLLGTDVNDNPKAHVAVTSATGNNDLDFFAVRSTDGKVTVKRVIGGHNDQALGLYPQVVALKAILAEDVPAAAVRFGQELGYCGCCGRHLTDQESRAYGIGPDCRRQYGF